MSSWQHTSDRQSDGATLIASLSDDKPIDWSSSIYRLAVKNDLLPVLLQRLEDSRFESGDSFELVRPQGESRILRRLELRTRELTKDLLNRLSSKNGKVVTIKSFLPFPYLDSNIDVVLPNAHSQLLAKQEVHSMGFRRFRNLADLREPMKEMYLPGDQEKPQKPYFHLHKSVSWNGLEYLNAQEVWSHRRIRKWFELDVPVPCPEHEILIVAAHAMFENKYLTLADLIHLDYLVKESPDWSYIVQAAEQYSWLHSLQLVLGIVEKLSRQFGLTLSFPMPTAPVSIEHSFSMPYVLPHRLTVPATLHKLGVDIKKRRISTVPRGIFTYLLVDPFWMYYKAYRKQ